MLIIFIFIDYRHHIPLLSLDDVNINLNDYKSNFKRIGKIINENNMRVDMHIDPYYVLNSVNSDVVKSSINICRIYQNMFNLMNINSNLIFHIGVKQLASRRK